jgi:hypothetical protein
MAMISSESVERNPKIYTQGDKVIIEPKWRWCVELLEVCDEMALSQAATRQALMT